MACLLTRSVLSHWWLKMVKRRSTAAQPLTTSYPIQGTLGFGFPLRLATGILLGSLTRFLEPAFERDPSDSSEALSSSSGEKVGSQSKASSALLSCRREGASDTPGGGRRGYREDAPGDRLGILTWILSCWSSIQYMGCKQQTCRHMGPGRHNKTILGAQSTQGLSACWLSVFCCLLWANTRAAADARTDLVLADELQKL